MRRASSLVGRSGCLSGNPSSCSSAKVFSLCCQNAASKKRNGEIISVFRHRELFAMARTKGALSKSTIRRAMMARRAQFAVIGEIDTTISLNSLAVLEEVMRHFYLKAKILESMGQEGDYGEVDKAWSETGRWAKEVAAFRHAKIQSVRLAGDLNAPVLPEHMTLDQLRVSILADVERLREMGVLDLPRLPQGVVANPNADLPMNGGSSDQAEE
jgi:hypothetical protein